MRESLARVLCLLLTVTLVPLSAGAALAQDGRVPPGLGIRLLEVPGDMADNPRAQLYLVDHVNPGATVTRELAVSNGTDEPMSVELFGSAASVEDGWVVERGRHGNELARWISVEPSRFQLAPGDSRVVEATIAVPGDADGGERYAAVVAAPEEAVGQGAVEVRGRVGIRVYLFVRGEEPPVEDFEIDTLTGGRDEDGAPYVLVGVANTGDRAIDVTGELVLTEGPGALTAGPFPVSVPRTVGPGDSGEVRVALDPDLPAGPWLARADLQSGLLERSAEATITFPDEPGALAPPADAEAVEQQRRLLIPIAGSLLLVALLLLLAFWWRRRNDDDADDEQHRTVAGARG